MITIFQRFIDVPGPVLVPAIRIAIWHFFFVWAVTGVKVATNAVFLARADKSTLPLLYVFVTMGVLVVSTYLARVLSQKPPALVLRTAMWVGAWLMLSVGVMLWLKVPYAPAAAYVLGEIITTGISLLFWARVSDAFSPRSKKLVVGFISGGGMSGAVVGGLLAHQLAMNAFLVLSLTFYFLLPAAMLFMVKGIRSRSRGLLKRERASLYPALTYMKGHAFPKWLALLVVGFAVLGALTDYVFRFESARLGEAEMASLFGILNAVVGVTVVCIQMSLTHRLLKRFGVFLFISITPIILGVLAVIQSFSDSFGILISMKGLEMAAAFSLNPAAIFLLYNPIPDTLRASVRTFIDGAIKKLGVAVAGLALLGIAAFSSESLVDSAWIAVSAFGLFIIFPFLHKSYITALDQKIGLVFRRGLHAHSINFDDADTQKALFAQLESQEPRKITVALKMLAGHGRIPDEHMLPLMVHEHREVRKAVLEVVPEEPNPALAVLLTDIVQQGSQPTRVQAIRALAKTVPRRVGKVLQPYFSDADPEVCMTALELAILKEDDAVAKSRFEALLAQRGDMSAVWKRSLAQLIGALDKEEHDLILLELIDDQNIEVQKLAMRAAGREQVELYIPSLLRGLENRQLRLDAQEALVAYGNKAVTALGDMLDDRSVSLPLRIRIPRVLERIGTLEAANALLFSNPVDDAELQQRIALRLYRMTKKLPDLQLSKERTDEAISRRLKSFSYYRYAYQALNRETHPDFSLLRRAVTYRTVENLRIVFELLSLHRERQRMMIIFRQIVDVRARTMGRVQDALELLDAALVADPLRMEILSALEEPEHQTKHLSHYVERLCASKDPVIRGIAQQTVIQAGPTGGFSSEEFFSMEGDPLIEGNDMPENIIDRLFILENVDLFENLGPDDLAAIAHIAEEKDYEEGAVIYNQGQPGDNMFVIVQGEVLLERDGQPILRLGRGETIGQVSLLDRGTRPVTAKVASPGGAHFLVLERKPFMDLVADRLGMMNALFDLLGQRFRLLLEREAVDRKR